VPGKFFLTGSADVLTLPKSLRVACRQNGNAHTVASFARRNQRRSGRFHRPAFQREETAEGETDRDTGVAGDHNRGGYPDVVKRKDENRRTAWFRSYITSILERDVRDLSNIEGLKSLPNLLALIASRTGGLLNMSDLARSFELTNSTLKRYLVLLETVYLVVTLQPWSRNLGKRLVKSPKLFLNDTGLLCYLLECNAKGLERNRQLLGFVF